MSRSQVSPRNVRLATLNSGLTVASIRAPALRTTAIAAFVGAGVREEPSRLNGLSHMIEHLAFKGTRLRDARELSMAIERVGASMNAYTTKELTVYHVDALPAALPVAVEALADIVLRPAFAEIEIERERKVIAQEIAEAADDPESLAQEACDAAAFPRQSLGRSILGTRRQLNAITHSDLVAYHSAHYRANNIVVVAGGQVDHDQLSAEVERRFESVASVAQLDRTRAHYVGGFRHIDDDFGSTNVQIAWPIPSRRDPVFAVWEFLAELLGGGASSPLFQRIREHSGLAYRVECWIDGYQDVGLLQIAAGVRPRNVGRFINEVCDTLAGLSEAIPDEELERTLNQKMMTLAQRRERPMDLVEAAADDLQVHGRIRTHAQAVAALRAAHASALRGALRTMLSQPPTVVVVGRMALADPLALLQRRLGRHPAAATA